jgi:hypothetical protein
MGAVVPVEAMDAQAQSNSEDQEMGQERADASHVVVPRKLNDSGIASVARVG